MTLGLTSEDKHRLEILKDVPSNLILFGIILFYPRDRISERVLVNFFDGLARQVPTPFSESRMRDVPQVMADLHGGPVRARDDSGEWYKNQEYISRRAEELRALGFLPLFEPPLRFLAERLRMYAERPAARLHAP